MEYRQLGATNLKLSRIGFGCGPASGHDYGHIDENEWRAAVRDALDAGINLFDVANVYGFGHAEELLADALGDHRHKQIIATKGGLVWDHNHVVRRDLSAASIRQSVDDSLRRLRLQSITLYQIHWPDPQTPLHETFAALAQCQREGKIQHLGVSNFPLALLEDALKIARIESLQLAYNLLSREPELEIFPRCAQNQVSVLAHTPLARGALSAKNAHSTATDFTDTRKDSPYFAEEALGVRRKLSETLQSISARNHRSVSSVALRWILDEPAVTSALVGIRDRAQLKENLEAVGSNQSAANQSGFKHGLNQKGWNLTATERDTLSQISAQSPAGLKGVPAHASFSKNEK